MNTPDIFVRSRGTGETYKFLVGAGGALVNEGIRFDQGHARRTLFRRREAKAGEPQTLLGS